MSLDDGLEEENDDMKDFFEEIDAMNIELNNKIKEFEDLGSNADLFDDLYNLLRETNKKLSLLMGLKHETIREQYLIDLFLTESISIYEGFVHSLLISMRKYSEIFDKLSDLENVYEAGILSKNRKNEQAANFDQVISILLKKTLNNPLDVKKIFEIIFHIRFVEKNIFEEESFKINMKNAIEIRNAHIHRNGIYSLPSFNLDEVNEILGNLISFIAFLGIAISKNQKVKYKLNTET